MTNTTYHPAEWERKQAERRERNKLLPPSERDPGPCLTDLLNKGRPGPTILDEDDKGWGPLPSEFGMHADTGLL